MSSVRSSSSKSTRPADGGLQWTFDPLHKTWSPRPFETQSFCRRLEAIERLPSSSLASAAFGSADEEDRMAKIKQTSVRRDPDVGHMIHWFEPLVLAATLADSSPARRLTAGTA